ncbi:MAG: hypothetical protein OJF62_000622 [Pseudolabrys sp.]|nr:hypothetical protein [Pseudolabrys sp.]
MTLRWTFSNILPTFTGSPACAGDDDACVGCGAHFLSLRNDS